MLLCVLHNLFVFSAATVDINYNYSTIVNYTVATMKKNANLNQPTEKHVLAALAVYPDYSCMYVCSPSPIIKPLLKVERCNAFILLGGAS